MGEPSAPELRFAVDAIAFDLDGTLLDTIHDLAASVNALLAELGLPTLAQPIIRNLVGKGIGNLLARAVEISRGQPPSDNEQKRWLARYQEIYGARLGNDTLPFPELHAMLDHFAERGFGLAVITNKTSRFVRPHLALAGIERYFGVVIGADDATARKPDAAPMLLAAQRLGTTPQRMLMVGDSANDVAAARAAGCPVVVLPHGYSEGVPVESLGADAIVPSLLALTRIVVRANPSP